MSATRSPEEIRRQMLGRFDAGNGAAENRRQTRLDALAREVAAANKCWSRRDTDADITNITSDLSDSDLSDIGENDALGG